jgi:uncharacterized membrane protein YfcA
MPELIWKDFITLDLASALQVVLLGFIGGTLSGFIGSGGAFFMTPGMMNLGVPGVIAVGSNITHKFGKAMMGSRRHGELGNVDKKMGVYLLLTSFVGIRLAVWINSTLFAMGDSHGEAKGAAANLYISVVFVGILTVVAVTMLRDVLRSSDAEGGPSRRIADFLAKLRLSPVIHFPVADVKVSLWVVMAVGLATGYLAGTIGVGGFIGVPAMIYVFGMATAVAAGTELFLAMFMGAFGALNYVWAGLVDIRLTLLLYTGSLFGIYVGTYGTKVVREVVIRLVTALVILICCLSRAIAVPAYLRQLGWINIDPGWDNPLNQISKLLLVAAGVSGVGVILFHVVVAMRHQSSIRKRLSPTNEQAAAAVPKRGRA